MGMILRRKFKIFGAVQGVGFRPAVYRIAHELELTGFVYNDADGVTVELQGSLEAVDQFRVRLEGPELPAAARIEHCEQVDVPVIEGEDEFVIQESAAGGKPTSQVTIDLATCADCKSELFNKGDFRYRYPFINCTNCGPRYSIIKTIPYDRANTTMSVFGMCPVCSSQYKDVNDRRFHAQPVACEKDGPHVWLCDSNGKQLFVGTDDTVKEAAKLLREGGIVAIKGIGGFHLAVSAFDNAAVERLRQRKRREHKPFAMMADSVETVEKHCFVSEHAARLLRNPQAPIVILPKRWQQSDHTLLQETQKGSTQFSHPAGTPSWQGESSHHVIAASVAHDVNTYGFMLCYAPLHYLLFAEGLEVLVMTSGNLSDEPLVCDNDEALRSLGDVADAFVMHDREIFRQVDDSIVHFVDETAVPLRRARGYVPSPVMLNRKLSDDVLALGGDLKNTFCIGKGSQLICSEHIGDLEDAQVYRNWVRSIAHLRKLYEVEPAIVAADLHPGYLSSQYAEQSFAAEKILRVQHHWAHVASVLAENNFAGPVIGLECDGTGYGTDGAIWGCECLIASLKTFRRFGHLAYYPLAGSDAASKEPLRPLLGILWQMRGQDMSEYDWLLEKIEPDANKRGMIAGQISKGINTVQSSSLGRVFDAVAAVCGIGNYNYFEAQLPIALEAAICGQTNKSYIYDIVSAGEEVLIDLRSTFAELLDDAKEGIDAGLMSAKFHNTMACALADVAKMARDVTGLNVVAMSGGVFCNRYLAEKTLSLLRKDDFEVLFNREVPSNDGGLSLGQAAIAAEMFRG